MRKLLDALFDLMFPPRCPFCHRFLNGATAICAHCELNLPYTPIGVLDRRAGNVDEYYSALYYKGVARESILRYKFSGLSMYADFYAPLMCNCADDNELYADVVTWVPLSAARLRTRGYDQARMLAEPVAEYLELECVPLLKKRRNNAPQSGTNGARERRRNVRGVYSYIGRESLAGKCVLLIDDVVTTGATLEECAQILKRAGAKKILALTLACTMD